MAKTSTITTTINVTGDGVTESYQPVGFPIVNNAAPGGVPTPVTLTAGDNILAVPAGSTGWVLMPPSGSTITKRLKDSATPGDVGYLLSTTQPSILSIGAAQTTIRLNASTPGETVTIAWT